MNDTSKKEPSTDWDQQLRFSSILPDFSRCQKRDRRLSRLFSAPRTQIDYGDDLRQWVEMFGDENPSSILPVFVHGGYWRALRAEDHRFALKGLLKEYGQVANVEYRLMPGFSMQELVNDVLGAAKALAARGQKKLLLIGHSAGAHLCATALRENAKAGNSLPIELAVLISGLYDLAPVYDSFLRDETSITPEEVKTFSLDKNTWPDSAIAPLVVVGEDETTEFKRQSQAFKSLTGGDLLLLKGEHHMTILQQLFRPNSELLSDIKHYVNGVINL